MPLAINISEQSQSSVMDKVIFASSLLLEGSLARIVNSKSRTCIIKMELYQNNGTSKMQMKLHTLFNSNNYITWSVLRIEVNVKKWMEIINT